MYSYIFGLTLDDLIDDLCHLPIVVMMVMLMR